MGAACAAGLRSDLQGDPGDPLMQIPVSKGPLARKQPCCKAGLAYGMEMRMVFTGEAAQIEMPGISTRAALIVGGQKSGQAHD